MDSSDIEDRDDQCSGVPEYLQTKTAGRGLVKDALERIFRVKGDSENVGEMEDTPTETYQSLHRVVHSWRLMINTYIDPDHELFQSPPHDNNYTTITPPL